MSNEIQTPAVPPQADSSVHAVETTVGADTKRASQADSASYSVSTSNVDGLRATEGEPYAVSETTAPAVTTLPQETPLELECLASYTDQDADRIEAIKVESVSTIKVCRAKLMTSVVFPIGD